MAKQFVTVHFEGERIKEPVLCMLGRECDVVTNIFRADVSADKGWVVLELEGSQTALNEAMEYLRRRGVRPEPTREEDLPP
ncbi:MAG: NIL domain-containing protein [Candidatus Tectomicrobia bacterium]|nr:NIL domain-containing protein [Candidatus Tectomicrobia bacterium]